MKLAEISPLFQGCSTPAKLTAVLEENQHELIIALFAINVSIPEGLQEVLPCFYAFKGSLGFEELQSTEKFPPIVIQTLVLFATTFERAGSFGLVTPIRAILPTTSSVSLRFRAQELFYGLRDIRNGFVAAFPLVMDLLLQAQFDGVEEYTASVVQVAYTFLKIGRDQLRFHLFFQEEAEFEALFTNSESIHKYSFLEHPAIESLLAGETTGTLAIAPEYLDKPTPVLFPTVVIQQIFNQLIIDPVYKDPRTRLYDYPLGYYKDSIRDRILLFGRADFRESCLTVTPAAEPADRVLLYCYFNLRKHFFTTRYVFNQIIDSLPSILNSEAARPVFVDLGCGPMTSGLALADLYLEHYGQPLALNYVGIDIATAMLDKAREFEHSGLFAPSSQFAYYTSWSDALNPVIDNLVQVTNPIIFNASYLFASDSLNVSELALFINQLRSRCPESKMYFIFQNPNRADRNQKYLDWKQEIPFTKSLVQAVRKVRYANKRNAFKEPPPEEVAYELLAFQPD